MVQQANILPLRPLGQTQHQAEGLQEWLLLPFFFFFFVCPYVCISQCTLCVYECVTALLQMYVSRPVDYRPDQICNHTNAGLLSTIISLGFG